MSTPEQRAAWRELAAAATGGVWRTGPSRYNVIASGKGNGKIATMDGDDGDKLFNNAAFIAAAREAVPALLADVDALTQERDSMRLSHQLLAAKFDEACAERDALAAAWAQVVAISDEMNPKQGGPFGGDTNIAAYNMSRVRDVVREWKEAQNAVFE